MKKNEAKQLLVFGYGLPVISLILAWRQYAKHGLTVWVDGFVIAAGIVLLITLFLPSVLKFIFKYWMKAAGLIGTLVTVLILTVFFLCVITPVSIILRITGKDFMRLRSKATAGSYWIRREKANELYTQQF